MSVKIMGLVWELDLSQGQKLILLAIADHANDSGEAYPGVARVAWKSGFSIRQTKEILRQLRECEILELVGTSAGGYGQKNVYRIRTEKGAKLAPFTPERVRPSVKKGAVERTKRVRPSVKKGAVERQNPQRTLIEPSGNVREPSESSKAAQATKQPSPFAFSGVHLNVSPRQDELLAAGFPWVDRAAEYRRIDSWLEANPERRPKSSQRFLHNWFARISAPSNEKGGRSHVEDRQRRTLEAARRASA